MRPGEEIRRTPFVDHGRELERLLARLEIREMRGEALRIAAARDQHGEARDGQAPGTPPLGRAHSDRAGSQGADGDGQSNATETLAGTDPLNANSAFRILSAAVANENVQVAWTTVGGHSYVLQVATNLTGSLTTNFGDLGPVISVGGANEGTTNYLHVGGGTNRAGYYRVRLAP